MEGQNLHHLEGEGVGSALTCLWFKQVFLFHTIGVQFGKLYYYTFCVQFQLIDNIIKEIE
jgi:hypothetical protein